MYTWHIHLTKMGKFTRNRTIATPHEYVIAAEFVIAFDTGITIVLPLIVHKGWEPHCRELLTWQASIPRDSVCKMCCTVFATPQTKHTSGFSGVVFKTSNVQKDIDSSYVWHFGGNLWTLVFRAFFSLLARYMLPLFLMILWCRNCPESKKTCTIPPAQDNPTCNGRSYQVNRQQGRQGPLYLEWNKQNLCTLPVFKTTCNLCKGLTDF